MTGGLIRRAARILLHLRVVQVSPGGALIAGHGVHCGGSRALDACAPVLGGARGEQAAGHAYPGPIHTATAGGHKHTTAHTYRTGKSSTKSYEDPHKIIDRQPDGKMLVISCKLIECSNVSYH